MELCEPEAGGRGAGESLNGALLDNPDYVPAYQMSAQTMAANGGTEAACGSAA